MENNIAMPVFIYGKDSTGENIEAKANGLVKNKHNLFEVRRHLLTEMIAKKRLFKGATVKGQENFWHLGKISHRSISLLMTTP